MNGGVRVVIAIQPSSYAELCQFQRRTARLNNKGIIFYAISRSQAKFAGAVKDYLSSISKTLKIQADIENKKALREINKVLKEDEVMSDHSSSTNELQVECNISIDDIAV